MRAEPPKICADLQVIAKVLIQKGVVAKRLLIFLSMPLCICASLHVHSHMHDGVCMKRQETRNSPL